MPIRKLPPLLVNQIAAGEVIERPASVVKELVENSLDAGATRIEVAIEDGGQQLIRVSDDGKGIPPEELPLAVAPHATSKLQTADQLAAIETLGFRGEALASIASVSRVRITSQPHEGGRPSGVGSSIEASGDVVGEVRPAASAPGTTIEIRDLFFNTPARRKFMRTASTEFGHISELIQRVAMVHHRTGFKLSHNGRTTLDLPAEQTRARRCIEILGKELEEGLLEFSHAELGVQAEDDGEGPARPTNVWGLAGLPELARATAKFQYLCVNGRPIRDKNVSHAIREAYRGLCPPDKQPMVVVFLELDPRAVDVNVHPTKAEVRFRKPSAVHGLVLSSLRQRLLGADLTPRAAAGRWDVGGRKPEGGGGFGGEPAERPSVNSFVDYFKRMDSQQKGFAFSEVRRALGEEAPEAVRQLEAEAEAEAPLLGREVSGGGEPERERLPAMVSSRAILQVHKSYVVTQDEEGLLIVDQHALHERVMFEELRRRVLGTGGSADGVGRALESQRMLMPAVVEADPSRMRALEALEPLLKRIGVEAAPMGPRSIGIQAFPSFLFSRGVEPEGFLAELLDKAAEGQLEVGSQTAEEAALHEVLDMMACKAAVKAGDQMTDAELAALLDKRHEVERSSNCPHGRPTTIRMTLKDLERRFGRA